MNKETISKIIKYEKLSTEELSELIWLANAHLYKERPVTIEQFISDDRFVHKKWPNIYPIWKDLLHQIFPTPFTAPYNEILISAAAGAGKCLTKGTKVLMYDGTIKNVEDIKVGDQLMGDDSTPRNVLSTVKGREKLYDVVPTRGGETWGCNESHILSLKSNRTKYKYKSYKKDHIENITVKEYLTKSKNYKGIMRLYRTAIDFHNETPLEIDPYIYGLWLGDGNTRSPILTNIDKPIIDTWYEYAKQLNLRIKIIQGRGQVCSYHMVSGSNVNVFRRFIYKIINKYGHKRILHEYKTASRENRLKLLAGIIDTDGYKSPKKEGYEVTSKYKDLAEDYLFLARSLGFRCSLKAKFNKKYQRYYYRVNIAGDISQVPVKLERKKSKREFRDGDPLKTSFKLIDKGIGDYYGFTIDGNHLFVLGDFTVTHNTVVATVSNLYDMYKLGCLKDPCSFYNLSPGTMLIFAVFSATGSTAAVNWQDITTGIEMCPWLNEKVIDRRGLEKKSGSLVPVQILPGIYIQTGSKFQHSMGKAIFDGLMDEAAFGGDNIKEAQKTYDELSSRMATRFRSYSKTGNLPGHLFLISSPKEAGDFMQYRIEKAESTGSKHTLVKKNISSWDANPANDSDEKFTVFVGNEFKEPKIYENNEQPPFEDIDYLIYPPMSYYDNFKTDILGSIMNYGGVTTIADTGLFKSPTLVNDVMVLDNPFNMNIIKLPFDKDDKQLMDFMDMSYFRDIRHPEANRFIHIDVAFSSNTIDRYGIAASYCTLVDRTVYKDYAKGNVNLSEVFNKSEKMYYVDWALGIEPLPQQEIPLSKVRDFIFYLIKNLGYPVASISADTFQSKQTLQDFEQEKYPTESISVDRSRDPYLFLKNLVYNKQILTPTFPELKKELLQLRDNGKKIDHPINGCFTGDTMLIADNKQIKIEDLAKLGKHNTFKTISCDKNGNLIYSKGYNAHETKKVKEIIILKIEYNEVIKCTPEHLIMLEDLSYRQAKDLKIGDKLKGVVNLTITNIQHKHYDEPIPVYDITVPDYNNFMLDCGVIVHNSKDIADAVAGSIWNCSNSNKIVNISKITQAVLNPYMSPMQYQTMDEKEKENLENYEFERMRSQFANGLFKGL